MGFVRFMASGAGRTLRVVAGLALVAIGIYLAAVAGNLPVGIIVGVVGLVPLAAGLFDFCVFAPLFGCPLPGKRAREMARAE